MRLHTSKFREKKNSEKLINLYLLFKIKYNRFFFSNTN